MDAKDFEGQLALEQHEINTFNLNDETIISEITAKKQFHPFMKSHMVFYTQTLPPIIEVNASNLEVYGNMFKYGLVDYDGQINEIYNKIEYGHNLNISQEGVVNQAMSDIKKAFIQKLNDWLDSTRHQFTFMSYTDIQINALIKELEGYEELGENATVKIILNATSYYRYGKDMKPIKNSKDYINELKKTKAVLKELMTVFQGFAEDSYPKYLSAFKRLFDNKEERQEFIDELLSIANVLLDGSVKATQAKQIEHSHSTSKYESDTYLGLYYLTAKTKEGSYPNIEIRKKDTEHNKSKEKITIEFTKKDMLEILSIASSLADDFVETERIIDRFVSNTLTVMKLESYAKFPLTGLVYLISKKFRYLYNMMSLYTTNYSRVFMITKATVEAAYGICKKAIN